MSPKINLNPVLNQYCEFVSKSGDKNVASRLFVAGKDGSYRMVKEAK